MNGLTRKLHFSRITFVFSGFLFVLLTAISVFAIKEKNVNRNSTADFDGDGKSDISVYRPSDGNWYVLRSTGGYSIVKWGTSADAPVPGDYDGDGKTDYAVYRSSNNSWSILKSSDNSSLVTEWGVNIKRPGYINYNWDAPIPADYDGDGKTDLAVYTMKDYLPAPGNFVSLQSTTGSKIETQWGTNADKIVTADYDGDGKKDYAVFRRDPFAGVQGGVWYILQSSNGEMRVEFFGLTSDVPVPSDYDGDGRADIAVWRPSDGVWYHLNSSNNSFNARQFGLSDDKPAPADYDGDGKTDIAVFRPSNGVWYLQRSTEGFAAQQFGLANDIPIANSTLR